MEIKKCPFCGGIGELTMDEKIKKMAKIMYGVEAFELETLAEALYNAGYRKESDTAREIYKELFEKQTEVYNKYVFKNDDYDDLETNAIINFSDSLSYEFEKFFKEKYGVYLGE